MTPVTRPAVLALVLAVLRGVVPSASFAQSAPPSVAAARARVDSLAAAFLRESRTPGLSLAVVRGRDTLAVGGYGVADRESRRAAGPATVYRIGSLTKQFTSAAVLQLVDDGRVRLTDTLGAYLPQYPRWGRVTVRQLLNHTSGIPSYTGSTRWQARMAETLPPDSVLAFVAGDSARFAPGARYEYNNTGYFLLGRLLERVTGRSYAAVMRERFFAPLGLRSASYCPDVPSAPSHARGYERKAGDSALAPASPISMTSPYSAGALCMNVPDFVRWQDALAGGRVVRPATYARMATADTLGDGSATTYGWGLGTGAIDGRPVVSHTGGINGFTTAALVVPGDSLRVAVFTNASGPPGPGPMTLAQNLARAALGLPLRTPPRPVVAAPLPDSVRAAVAGTYLLRMPNGAELPLTLWSDGGRLYAQARGPGQGAFPLLYRADGTFGAAFDPSLRLRVVVEGGRGARAVLEQGGATMEGARAP